jgi:hypothetical protein
MPRANNGSNYDLNGRTPFEYGQFRSSLNGGSKFINKLFDSQVKQHFGTYGDAKYQQYLDGLNAGTAADVDAFYNGYDASYGGDSFYQGGVGNGAINNSYNPYASINVNRYDHLDKKDNPADKLYADLIRAQTQDYQTRYAPVEDYMANQITATGTRALGGDLRRTENSVLGASANVGGQQQRAMARMGLSAPSSTPNNQSTIGALVGGMNDTRVRDSDRRQAILNGNLGSISQKARGSV